MKIILKNSSLVFNTVKTLEDIYDASENIIGKYVNYAPSGNANYLATNAESETTQEIPVNPGDRIRIVLKLSSLEKPNVNHPYYCVFINSSKRVINGTDYEDSLTRLQSIIPTHCSEEPDTNGCYTSDFTVPANAAWMLITVKFNNIKYLTDLHIYKIES